MKENKTKTQVTYVEDSLQNPQFASAEKDAFSQIKNSNSGNKVVYIVKIKDSEIPTKSRIFAALKKLENSNTVEVTGYEIIINNKTKKTQKLDKSEVLEKAEEENIVQLCFPWHMVLEIQNLSYQHNKQKQVK
jgi:hypothetical protein